MNLALVFIPVAMSLSNPSIKPDTTIWTTTPAASFMESSVLGNGRIGGMVFGGVAHERVVLNESTMWSGSKQDADRAEAFKALPAIRELLLKGENSAAEDLVNQTFTCKGGGSGSPEYGCYQTFCNLNIDSPDVGLPSNYRRVLDLERAVTTLSYSVESVNYTREAFTSGASQVFAYRYRADKPGQVTFDASLGRQERAATRIDGSDLVLEGQLDSGNPAVPGVKFCGRLRAIAKGGRVVVDQAGIHVIKADEVTLLFTAGTSMFESAFAAKAKAQLDAASHRAFEALESDSVRDHRRFFDRVSLSLPKGPSAYSPTPERLIASSKGEQDPSLAALYFNFGRYLIISGSRPDSPLPNNLQGIWAEELHTPWAGDFHLDINVQMNYWPAETTNLGDCQEPLIRLVQRMIPNGEKTAQAYYSAKGWVSHAITNPWEFTSPGEAASWGSINTTGAWLCESLWNHYAFTLDRKYLRDVYPTLRGAAAFFLDSLVEEPKHGWLVTSPSNSPENHYFDPTTHKILATCMGPTMDMSILRELLGNVVAASKELRIDEEFRAKVEKALSRLAPFQVGKYGQVQEWLEDYEEPEPHHRHISVLYGLYPGNQISPDQTPALAKAAQVTLERRGDDGVGWSLAWKVCFWARLHNGDHAWQMLRTLFRPATGTEVSYTGGGGAYPNMLDASPPFQIDGNFGGTAAIAEMLLQSRPGEIRLLPALPKDWPDGSVTGLKAYGNLTVDISWKAGSIANYKISGPNAKRVTVKMAGN